MHITHLHLRNWRNFRDVDVRFSNRVFLVGPNASGKSNLLDALRFARDVAESGGGFQRAVERRNGVSALRSLHARGKNSDVEIALEVDVDGTRWWYELAFSQDAQRRPLVRSEKVLRGDETILERPDSGDRADPSRLTQSHVEQINANHDFRDVADALGSIRYFHIVPQLVREPERSLGRSKDSKDPFGGDFLEQMATLQKDNKKAFVGRMRRIQSALSVAIPNLKALELRRDHRGVPHLEGQFEHWRPGAGWQREDQFSDGSLRLLGLLWAALDGRSPILLEEPELSLHPALVRLIPMLLARISSENQRQFIVSTHSPELLSDEGIAADEVLMLEPANEGTRVRRASDKEEVNALVAAGWRVGDAVLPSTAPKNLEQLLFERNGEQ